MSKMFTHPDGTEFKSSGELLDYVDTLKLRQRMAKEERDMPCFFCKAFGDDEQCLNNRTSVNDKGVEGLDCPRIRKEIGEQEAAFAKMGKDARFNELVHNMDKDDLRRTKWHGIHDRNNVL